ncbi:MAG: hypothetical protein ACM36A_02715 [Bacteroidota bacterium]
MAAIGDPPSSAAGFQARLFEFRRIARLWSSLIVLVAAAGTVIQFTTGEITDKDSLSLWVFGIALLFAFTVAAFRIYFAYEQFFICPVCGHHPRENDLSSILLGVWYESSLNPSSCAICGTKLREERDAL